MKQKNLAVDVVVVGAGPAGLATGCLVAQAGHRVAIVAPRPAIAPDPRTVALMQPAIQLLATIGIWPGRLDENSAPLKALRLVDDTGGLLAAPEVTFRAEEIGLDEFGWNIPLDALRSVLASHAAELPIHQVEAEVVESALTASGIRLMTTAEGSLAIDAAVVIAADGRNSRLRSLAGIDVTEWNYEQSALASAFDHSAPHGAMSVEYHKQAGLVTTVPLPGNRSSLVWMDRPDRIAALMTMDDATFASAIQAELHGNLGRVSGSGPRQAFPMRGMSAQALARRRIMLVGEAGHLLPPIGAQGLNMSLRDGAHAADLIDAALKSREDPGSDAVLNAYDQQRRGEIMPRQAVVDLVNRSLLSTLLPVHLLRAAGLTTVAALPWLRRFMIEQGLGSSSDLPAAMRPPATCSDRDSAAPRRSG